jgi:hypothetical protein
MPLMPTGGFAENGCADTVRFPVARNETREYAGKPHPRDVNGATKQKGRRDASTF